VQFRCIETKRTMLTKDLLKSCGLDTALGLHSGPLDHRNSLEI